MKKIISIVFLSVISVVAVCAQQSSQKAKQKENSSKNTEISIPMDPFYGKVEPLTTEAFKDKIFDYTAGGTDFKYKGDVPCVIDFYADWCRPCKMLAPILEEAAANYKGKIKVYKVNVEENNELSQVFGISSIPLILFIPQKGQPSAQAGLLQKEQIEEIIKNFLLVEETK